MDRYLVIHFYNQFNQFLPIVDEFVINVGESEDDTLEIIQIN
jgi:hypothetical protein